MNETKHTPGPWFLGAQNDCLFVTNREPPRGDYDRELRSICKVGPDPTDEANARLIAAAPDLFEACKAALDFLRQPVPDGGQTVALETRLGLIGGSYTAKQLADAIAKATGGPSDA